MIIYIVDAFTKEAFTGNPAAVCILTQPVEDSWMQNVAREMNLSETAFVFKRERDYLLRWFTPKVEVDLCGHATLASAHILWETACERADNEIVFYTKSGTLTARRGLKGIELDFPAEPPHQCTEPEFLREGLGIQSYNFVGRNRMDYLVEVESEEIIRSLKPNFQMLGQIQTRGIIVTSQSENGQYDFVSRCFFPVLGVNEDPVTGSAHCCLGPYWKGRMNKAYFSARQLSERSGVIEVAVMEERVMLTGNAITVLKGKILV